MNPEHELTTYLHVLICVETSPRIYMYQLLVRPDLIEPIMYGP